MLTLESYPTLSREDILNRLSSRFRGSVSSLKGLPDPNSFKGMAKATSRIIEAIEAKERIVVVGDYDVDGVVSTAVMRIFFEAIDYPIEWVIPNRFRDGYGISLSLLERVKDADLIITVDNGISANEAISECKSLGIDVIITDHHIVPENPPDAFATINQKQPDCSFPFDEVCGAQIAWYLCASIRRALGLKLNMKKLLEIVSLAIIADIMPLLEINRVMVKSGLEILSSSQSPFILAYKEMRDIERLSAEDVAFGLAPVINSAGRVDDAKIACNYLCSKTLPEAREYLRLLNDFNQRRKELEALITQEAKSRVDESQEIIVAYGEDWSEGVVGIVASRVSREFKKPSIILTKKGNLYKGSGRSFGECNLFEAVNGQRELLVGFGGHSKAIGLAVDKSNLESFIANLQTSAKTICPKEPYQDPAIFGELSIDEVDDELFYMIEQFEPFGHANRRPKFISRGILVESLKLLGDGTHAKYTLKRTNQPPIEAIEFRINRYFEAGSRVDILYTIGENIFNGNRKLQLIIEEIDETIIS